MLLLKPKARISEHVSHTIVLTPLKHIQTMFPKFTTFSEYKLPDNLSSMSLSKLSNPMESILIIGIYQFSLIGCQCEEL